MGSVFVIVLIIVCALLRAGVNSKKKSSKTYKSKVRQEADMQSMVQARRDARRHQEKLSEKSVRQMQKHYETAKPNRPEPGTVTARPNQPEPGTVTAIPNRPDPGEMTAKPNVPRKKPTGMRGKLEEYKKAKHSSAKSAAVAFEDRKKEDILTAAKENTVEVAQDNDRDEKVWAVNLDQVYDLMVKGPADTLSVQRDFVAEGMDMLNKLTTLPDSGVLSEYL